MDRSSMLLMAISTVATLFLVIGHRTGWIMSALTDFSPSRRERFARSLGRRASPRQRLERFRPRLGGRRRWWRR